MFHLLPFLLAFLGVICSLHATTFRTFTSDDGRQLEARLVSYSSDKVVAIITKEGRAFDVPLDRFCDEDQQFIKEWHEENADLLRKDSIIDVYVGARKSKSGIGSSVGGQTQVEVITPVVRITNQEWEEDFRGVKGVLVVLARDVRNKGYYKVLNVEDLQFELIPHGETMEWFGKPTETSWYDDDGDGQDDTYGYRYKGYLIVLLNRNGEQVYTKGTRSAWEGPYAKVKKLKADTVYDEDLKTVITSSYY